MSNSATQTSEKSKFKKILESGVSLFFSLLLVFAVRSSVIEAFKIPSGSMIPTLLVGDYIFVNKFSYGFHFPFSEYLSDEGLTLIHRDPPSRGDIIVFKYPKNESIYFIKRVIGVPGDTIQLKNKVLYINGQEMKQTLAPQDEQTKVLADVDDAHTEGASLKLYYEQLGKVKHWIILDQSGQRSFEPADENFGPVTVPSDSLFCMGDNRDFSNDSRYWGFVPLKNVKGRALFIWMSLWFADGSFSFHPLRTGTILR